MAGNNDTRLADLHDLFCTTLRKRLENGEDHVVAKTGDIVKTDCSAATLREIRQFLLDNEVNCVPTKTNPLGQLAAAASKLPFPKE
jgi:hypothetical protein